ncbi:hypothetical protein [Nodosilinea nodulosa]|uniref:hypothetical protein n=1 Tax=Nodosilinea nodulosa TaxID=416001 RepID=UPI0012D7B1D8|nr:hypothetical protein [Nodosilinea nodulosa]
MLRTPHHMADIGRYSTGLSDRLLRLAAAFVRFSSFYGNYQALPPSKRRQFVLNQQRQKP